MSDLEEQTPTGLAVWNLGFRPFFLGAGLFSAFAIAAWLWVYNGKAQIYTPGIAPSLWHAHEMLFGYAFAVIAGFLLTAVKNWTGLRIGSIKALPKDVTGRGGATRAFARHVGTQLKGRNWSLSHRYDGTLSMAR